MKKTVLIIVAAVLASCWKVSEDRSICVEANLVLRFAVQAMRTGGGGQENIDIFLFDENGFFFDARRVESVPADGMIEVEFEVPPAVYHVVCWANVDNLRTAIRRNGSIESCYVEITSSEHGSQLWYAPYKEPAFENGDRDPYRIMVKSEGETVVDLVFAKAHRRVVAYAVGFGDDTRSESGLVAEHTGACGRYDFLLQAHSEPVALRRPLMPDPAREGDVQSTLFDVMLHPLHGGEHVNLTDASSDELLASVNLAEYVAENAIDDDSDIEIAFVYNKITAEVSVQLPRWSDIPIKPEI